MKIQHKMSDDLMTKFEVRSAIRMVIGGYLYDGNNIEEIPSILEEMSEDYQREINKLNPTS